MIEGLEWPEGEQNERFRCRESLMYEVFWKKKKKKKNKEGESGGGGGGGGGVGSFSQRPPPPSPSLWNFKI